MASLTIAAPTHRPSAAAPRRSTPPVRLTRRGRRLVRTTVLALALVVTLVVLSVGLGAVSSASEGSAPTTTRVVVQPGQTLWSIASAALPDLDPRAAVGAVADLNGLSASSEVVPGQALLLPLGG